MASSCCFLLLFVAVALLTQAIVQAAPATQYLNPYPDLYEPVRKTMVVSQFPSRASNRPYTPIFEEQQDGRGGGVQQQRGGGGGGGNRYEQEQDEDDFDYGEQFGGGAEGLQFLW